MNFSVQDFTVLNFSVQDLSVLNFSVQDLSVLNFSVPDFTVQWKNELFSPRLFSPELYSPRLFSPELFSPRLFSPRPFGPKGKMNSSVQDQNNNFLSVILLFDRIWMTRFSLPCSFKHSTALHLVTKIGQVVIDSISEHLSKQIASKMIRVSTSLGPFSSTISTKFNVQIRACQHISHPCYHKGVWPNSLVWSPSPSVKNKMNWNSHFTEKIQ